MVKFSETYNTVITVDKLIKFCKENNISTSEPIKIYTRTAEEPVKEVSWKTVSTDTITYYKGAMNHSYIVLEGYDEDKMYKEQLNKERDNIMKKIASYTAQYYED